MRWLLWVIALAALAVGSVLVARVNQGFVLLVTPVYRVELSLNLAIVILVAVIIAGYLLVRALAVTMSMPSRRFCPVTLRPDWPLWLEPGRRTAVAITLHAMST